MSDADKRMVNEVLDTWDNQNRKMIPKGEVFFAAAELNTKNAKFFQNISMTKIDELVNSKYPGKSEISY